MPYGRCVIYMFPGDAEEIIGKARTGILPIFKSQAGFVAFGVMVRGNQLISMSAWKSERDAKAADELAREWVSENVNMTVVNSFMGDYEWFGVRPAVTALVGPLRTGVAARTVDLVAAWSVFSSQSPRSELESLMQEFGPVGARNSAHLMRPAHIRVSGRRGGRVVQTR